MRRTQPADKSQNLCTWRKHTHTHTRQASRKKLNRNVFDLRRKNKTKNLITNEVQLFWLAFHENRADSCCYSIIARCPSNQTQHTSVSENRFPHSQQLHILPSLLSNEKDPTAAKENKNRNKQIYCAGSWRVWNMKTTAVRPTVLNVQMCNSTFSMFETAIADARAPMAFVSFVRCFFFIVDIRLLVG